MVTTSPVTASRRCPEHHPAPRNSFEGVVHRTHTERRHSSITLTVEQSGECSYRGLAPWIADSRTIRGSAIRSVPAPTRPDPSGVPADPNRRVGGSPAGADPRRSRPADSAGRDESPLAADLAIWPRPRFWVRDDYISAFRAWTNAVESALAVPWSAWTDDARR
jgi:hypothetical protein